MTKYLILGNGFLGNSFAAALPTSELTDARITSHISAVEIVLKYDPDVVINCIGKTGSPNIDWCESHREETLDSNVMVPLYLADTCERLGKKLVHIGSGCIYTGDNGGRGFSEEDEPNFRGSFYSRTKILSEKLLKEFDALQIRIRMPIGEQPSPRNLISKLLKYSKIIQLPNSVSVVSDVVNITTQLISKNASGIFNVVSPEPVIHKWLLDVLADVGGPVHKYESISLDELHSLTVAHRSNCVMSIDKLKNSGVELPDFNNSLISCLTAYATNLKTGV